MAEVRSSVQHHCVNADEEGQRIDNYLMRLLKGVPRSRIYRLLRKGEVRVNGSRARPTRRLQAGEVVRLPPITRPESTGSPDAPSERLAKRLAEGILYEDDQLLILDKPSGLAVHGGSSVRLGLIEALRCLRPDAPYLELVHRLDRETSGCIMVAKQAATLRELHAQLRAGRVEKRYRTLLAGCLANDSVTVEAPLERLQVSFRDRQVRVSGGGRAAKTAFTALQRYDGYTLAEARIETGRMHQIRVHAAHIDHPVAGDDRYGDRRRNAALRSAGLTRLFLHAHSLELLHPQTGKRLTVTAPMSADLQQVLEHLPVGGCRHRSEVSDGE